MEINLPGRVLIGMVTRANRANIKWRKTGKGGGGGDEAESVVSFPVCVYPKGSVVRCGSWDVRITPLQDSTAGVGGGLVSSRLCCGGQGLSGSNFEGSPGFSTISDKGTEGAT